MTFFLPSLLSIFLLIAMPPQFNIIPYIIEHHLVWEFKGESGRFAILRKTFFSPSLELFDAGGHLMARAELQPLSGKAEALIKNEFQQAIGTVRQRGAWVFKNWELYDLEGRQLAVSEMNWFATQFEIRSGEDHHLIARVERSLFRFSKSEWIVSIEEYPTDIDPLLLLTFIAYHTEYGT